MRTTMDALRSVKWAVAAALPEYEVRLWGEDADFAEPFARVGLTGPTVPDGSSRLRDMAQDVTVYAYVEPADDPELSILRAGELQERLDRAFSSGLTPERVPLYDFDGCGLYDVPTRGPHDYLRARVEGIRPIAESEDDRRIAVVVDLAVSWRRATERAATVRSGNVVESVHIEFVPEGAGQMVRPSGMVVGSSFGRPVDV